MVNLNNRSKKYLVWYAMLIVAAIFAVQQTHAQRLSVGDLFPNWLHSGTNTTNSNDLLLQNDTALTNSSTYLNRWLYAALRGFFSDIDWDTIEKARDQIEKFIQRVERIVGSVRSLLFHETNNITSGKQTGRNRHVENRLWNNWAKSNTDLDPNNLKEMLERVACFVGYARLMNLGNEALAELDASKVVTNLFGSSKKNSSFLSSLIG